MSGLRPLSLTPGRDFNIIAISINPAERAPDTAAKAQEIVKLYSRDASPAGWHFSLGLRGTFAVSRMPSAPLSIRP